MGLSKTHAKPQINCTQPFTELTKYSELEIFQSCPDIKEIVERYQNVELGLGVAGEYPGNIASLFGHIFLVLIDDDLITSNTINYLAETDDSGFFKLIYFGLSKNFRAKYHVIPFYNLETTYSGLEGRDLTIYKFRKGTYNLNKLLFKFLEDERKEGLYHFFSQNCVTGIKALLKASLKEPDLIQDRSLDYPKYLVSDLRTRLDVFYKKKSSEYVLSTSNISIIQRNRFRKKLERSEVINSTNSEEEKYIRALYDFQAYKTKDVKSHQQLTSMFDFSNENTKNLSPEEEDSEEFKESAFSFGIGRNEDNDILFFNLMPSYRDMQFGKLNSYANSNFILLNTSFYYMERSLILNSIKILDLENNPNYLWPMRKLSWRIALEYDNEFNFSKQYRNYNGLGTLGISHLSKNTFLNFHLGPKFIHTPFKGSSNNLALHVSTKLVYEFQKLKFSVLFERDKYLSGSKPWTKTLYEFGPSLLHNDSNIQLRFRYEKILDQLNRELSLIYGIRF